MARNEIDLPMPLYINIISLHSYLLQVHVLGIIYSVRERL